MTSCLLQTELSLAALRLQKSQDELRAAIKKLHDGIAKYKQMLRYRLECPCTVHAHTACHTFNTNSTSAQSFNLHAMTSIASYNGIVPNGFAPANTSTAIAASHCQAPALLNSFTDADGITAYTTDTSAAFSGDPAVLRRKSSGFTLTTTGATDPTIPTTFSSMADNDAILKKKLVSQSTSVNTVWGFLTPPSTPFPLPFCRLHRLFSPHHPPTTKTTTRTRPKS
jgi:hypothetical protein